MLLSAINALTLSPALCGILLRPHHGPRRGPIGHVKGGIDHVRDLYGAAVARIVRFAVIGLVMVGVAALGVAGLNTTLLVVVCLNLRVEGTCVEEVVTDSSLSSISITSCVTQGQSAAVQWLESHPPYRSWHISKWKCQFGDRKPADKRSA